ncbi:hypothetical protein F5148DRAFT_1216603 [Russula earlei]|uniref:Uncharacterized protein n=1 Tax=Russula earlei TaxID=71964 RepID=A0ACC0U4R3_9AGAM|nr:hypothetical protein F5148DRAFT_1216603 [Russula earlei]
MQSTSFACNLSQLRMLLMWVITTAGWSYEHVPHEANGSLSHEQGDATHILSGELSPVRRASVTMTMSKVIIIALRRLLLDHDCWSLTSVVGSNSL